MGLFLLMYVTLYGAMEGYALWRARAVFSLSGRGVSLLAAWMVLMLLAPILVRLTEKAGWEPLARALAWVGYLWLGLLFVYLCASWSFDVWRAVAAALRHPGWAPGGTASFWAAAGVALLATAYGLAEAAHVRTTHLVVRSAKVPASAGRFRIVQLSDVHLGLLVRHGHLGRVVRAAAEAGPDLVVSTGDLVDGELGHLDGLSRLLAELPAPGGRFAVMGNHEFYAGADQAVAFHGRAGFTLLRGERAEVGEWLELIGVDDPTGARFAGAPLPDEARLLSEGDPRRFRLLLKHQPSVSRGSEGRFDLQLSGHVHGGQIFPFHALVRLFNPLPAGRTELPAGGTVFVSRGAGTWGPPVRLFAPPEVVVVDLLPLSAP